MPSIRGGAKGDELVTVHVVVPTKMSKRERELLEEYGRAGGDRIEELDSGELDEEQTDSDADRRVDVELLHDLVTHLLGGLGSRQDPVQRLEALHHLVVGDVPVREEPLAGPLGHVVQAVGDGGAHVVGELAGQRDVRQVGRIGDLPQGQLSRRQRTIEVLRRRHRLSDRLGATGQKCTRGNEQGNRSGSHFVLSFRGSIPVPP